MKTYTAILIDSEKRIIDEVQYTDYKSIQKHIGCDLFCVGDTLENHDTLYIDDEGLINGTKHGFYWNGRLFAGNGLLCGSTSEGKNQNVQTRIGQIENMVKFLPFGYQLNPDEMMNRASFTFTSF
jgi:hypothetical protein